MVIFTGPVGPYYPKPVRLIAEEYYVRAVVGGVGEAKAAGNYAASLLPAKKAKEAGYEIKVGKFPFSASGKASAGGDKSGFVKVIYDAKYGEWLGAHMIGSNVTEMIAEAVAARKLETTGHEILKAIHPHPTMSEAVMEATAAAYDGGIHL